MVAADRTLTQNRARRIVQRSGLDWHSYAVMLALVGATDWKTRELPAEFTPKRGELARIGRVGPRQLVRLLEHLALHRWLAYTPGRGPGTKTVYLVLPDGVPGQSCDCPHRRHGAVSNAERMRRYRARRRAEKETSSVTPQPEPEAGKGVMTRNAKETLFVTEPQVNGHFGLRESLRGEELDSDLDVSGSAPALCYLCRERPVGGGLVLCPECRDAAWASAGNEKGMRP